ncbi:MAG: polysaccharide deacetylase family protein [Defluviitaleaceae bacterium]|nr:polysaccharide deacetylase family protein [Defluviitaleaceae bacterium]
MRKFLAKFFQWKATFLIFIFAISAVAGDGASDTEAFFRRDKEAHVPIIMYHLVTEDSRYIGKYGVRPSQLEDDLKFLQQSGYNTVVMQDLINFVEDGKSLPNNPIVLTFDDGNSSDHKYLLPLLEQYDMKAVISVIGKAVDENTEKHAQNPAGKYPNLTWSQLKEIQAKGIIEVQNHGYNVHGRAGSGKLKHESAEAYHQRLTADLKKLQDLCQEHLGEEPTTFCYPLGIISKGSQAVLEEMGFKASLSCQEGINIIKHGDKEGLFKLNRNNRPSNKPIEKVLDDIWNNAKKRGVDRDKVKE